MFNNILMLVFLISFKLQAKMEGFEGHFHEGGQASKAFKKWGQVGKEKATKILKAFLMVLLALLSL
jgi:hypothetical protein